MPLQVSATVPFVLYSWQRDSRLIYTEFPDAYVPKDDPLILAGLAVSRTYMLDPVTQARTAVPFPQELAYQLDQSLVCRRVLPSPGAHVDRAEACQYRRDRPDGAEGFLRLVDFKAGTVITLTQTAETVDAGSLRWSPDGQQLFFVVFTPNQPAQARIWSRSSMDSTPVATINALTAHGLSLTSASVSPDFRWFAYYREWSDDVADLCVISIAGGDQRCFDGIISLRRTGFNDFDWSPNSDGIVVVSGIGGQPHPPADLQIIGIPDGHVTLAYVHRGADSPRWVSGP